MEKQETLKKEIDQALPGLQKTCAEERAKQADWIRILYGKRNGGWPLWELAIRYETYRDAPDGMAFSLKEISGVSAKTVNDWNGLLLRLVSAAQAVGHPCGHVLSGIGQTQDSRQLRVYAPQSLVLYREALEQVKQRAAALCDSLQEPAPTTKEALLQLYTFSTILSEMKSLPASWMGMTDFTGFLRKLREMTVHGKRERALFLNFPRTGCRIYCVRTARCFFGGLGKILWKMVCFAKYGAKTDFKALGAVCPAPDWQGDHRTGHGKAAFLSERK